MDILLYYVENYRILCGSDLIPLRVISLTVFADLIYNIMESRQFIDKTTHRHGFWRQFTDTIEDNSSTLFKDNSPTHLFEGNWQP